MKFKTEASAQLSFILVFGFSTLLMAAQLFYSAAATDQVSLERQLSFAERELEEIFRGLPRDQLSITIWDDAVEHTAETLDLTWLDENVGTWVADYFGHDEVFVLDGVGNPVLAYAEGGLISIVDATDRLLPVASLIRNTEEVYAKTRDSTVQTSGIVRSGERLLLASVSPILPSSQRVAAPEAPFLHVSVLDLDKAVSEFRKTHQFEEATVGVTIPDGLASVALSGYDGSIAGHFSWRPYRPGAELIVNSAPALGAAMAMLGALTWWSSRRLAAASSTLRASEAQARHLAFHDALTGLANRARFIDLLSTAQATDGNKTISVHFLDLDDFKEVNDRFGHATGDDLLRRVATALQTQLGPQDLAARLGGDEFVVMQVGGEPSWHYARKLLDAVSSAASAGPFSLQVSASVGSAVWKPGVGANELVSRADAALYRAKANGKGCIETYQREMDLVSAERKALELQLAASLVSDNQLYLALQPLYDAKGTTVCGAEALVRWRHPQEGNIPPNIFIPVAEASGLIVPLGTWILKTACHAAVSLDLDYVAVNVSPVQLRHPNFVACVREILSASGLAPQRLELEITEGVLIDREGSRAILAELRGMGVKIAIDDFGTGYSSLSYLKQFDIDKIKIDQSFVRQVGDDEGARSIVLAMVQLAKALRIEVTAEGIETRQQAAFMETIGCDQLQGYLFSKPVEAEVLRASLDIDRGRTAA